MKRFPAAVFLIGTLLAGCGSGMPGSAGQVSTYCTAVAPPVLLYPAPGASGITWVNLQLYFGYPYNPNAFFAPAVLTPTSGPALSAGPYASPSPGPYPPGMATVPNGDQVFVADVAPHVSGTTYTVSVKGNTCGTFTLGSFGT